jgi:argininosuccinate lyase
LNDGETSIIVKFQENLMADKNKKLWGGRFSGETSGITERISASIHYDSRLYKHDIAGSKAHARMLAKIGILSADELDSIIKGLETIETEISSGAFEFSAALEDIHMNIESRLTEMIGDAGKKLHTGRSRNDQIALDMRLYLRDESAIISSLLKKLICIITDTAAAEIDTVMPGYTHMQVAQPVRLSHHLLAYGWMLIRDLGRLSAAEKSCGFMPLGSGALSGVNYPSDREFLRAELGFEAVTANSMDTVSDRDFMLDFLYFASVLSMHLSRLCEELVLWSAPEFGYIKLADGVTTGSSIMPQKRNPDVAELIRGKSGRAYGNLFSLLTVMKGLPMTYNRDLQEDKEPVFDSVDTVKLCLEGAAEMLSTAVFNRETMKRAVYRNYSTATDLADYLVMKGVPFRECHEISGKVVRHCEEKGIDFFSLTVDDLKKFNGKVEADAAGILNPETSVERKLTAGGTSKKSVLAQIEAMKKLV